MGEKTVRIAPAKLMAVEAAGPRLAVYFNDKVLLLPEGDPPRRFGPPSGRRPYTTTRCPDASGHSGGSIRPALLTEGF